MSKMHEASVSYITNLVDYYVSFWRWCKHFAFFFGQVCTGLNCYLSSLDLITPDLQALNRDTHLVVNLLDEFFPDQLYPADKHFPGSIPFILVAGSCK